MKPKWGWGPSIADNGGGGGLWASCVSRRLGCFQNKTISHCFLSVSESLPTVSVSTHTHTPTPTPSKFPALAVLFVTLVMIQQSTVSSTDEWKFARGGVHGGFEGE